MRVGEVVLFYSPDTCPTTQESLKELYVSALRCGDKKWAWLNFSM